MQSLVCAAGWGDLYVEEEVAMRAMVLLGENICPAIVRSIVACQLRKESIVRVNVLYLARSYLCHILHSSGPLMWCNH